MDVDMDIRRLVAGLPEVTFWHPGRARIAHITADSREVRPGSLFVARPGASHDGQAYLREAVGRGAAAVLCWRAPERPLGVPALGHPDPAAVISQLADRLYGEPSRHLRVVGVTGTNGKTTTSWMLHHILARTGGAAALWSTVGGKLADGAAVPTGYTTPPAEAVQAFLAAALAGGAHYVVLETSSHALVQHRVAAVRFDGAVFTNLSGDHLDFHGDTESYYQAKRTLFQPARERYPKPRLRKTVCIDSPHGRRLAGEIEAPVHTVSTLPDDETASWRVLARRAGPRNLHFLLSAQGRHMAVVLPMLGAFNAANATCAMAAAEQLGVDPVAAARALASLPPVPGRMEPIPGAESFAVFIDYAHSDDALERVLTDLRARTRARLRVVFGCGGDRDRTKRPRMGQVAQRLADDVYLTSDNPRGERPEDIMADVLAGCPRPKRVACIADRRTAIYTAIADAGPGDVVLIAGKGHERYQLIGAEKLAFDDHEVAAEALRARTPRSRSAAAVENPCVPSR